MKNRTKRFFKIGLFLICFELLIFGCGYFYLDRMLEKTTANEPIESVPYYTQIPENKTILFRVCQDEILLNFDFAGEIINIIFLENYAESYGYTVNYNITCDYEMVGYLVDVSGGVEFENLRYTGVQITEMLEYAEQNTKFKREVAQNIFNGIANRGFTKENLLYIIENSETDLSFAESFGWIEFIPKLCHFARFVN